MKKLFILLSIISICYACKKETITPTTEKVAQTVNTRCQDSGICSEAYYESSSTVNPTGQYDTIIHKTGTNQLGQVKLTFVGYGPGTGLAPDTFNYKVSVVDFNPNLLDSTFQFIRYTSKGSTIPFFGVHTKSGLWIIFRFKQYI